MSHIIHAALLGAAFAVKFNLVLAALSFSDAGGVYKLECQNVNFCLSKLEVESISNGTGHYLTSLRFNGKEQCELPIQLAEVGGAPVADGIGLRAPPESPGLVCGETNGGAPYLLEIFIRRPESNHSPAYPLYACPRPVRHVKGRRYVLIRNRGNGHYCVYNELSSTATGTTLPPPTTAPDETETSRGVNNNTNQLNGTMAGTALPQPTKAPGGTEKPKDAEDNLWWRTPVIIASGAIAAATIGAMLTWHLNKRRRCCWNVKPGESEDDIVPEDHENPDENNANGGNGREPDNTETQNTNGNGGERFSVTNGDILVARGDNNSQATGDRYNFHNHNHYNFNGLGKATH